MSFFKGFSAFFRGMSFTFSRGLWAWYLVPLALWVFLVSFLSFGLADFFSDWLKDLLSGYLPATPPHTEGLWSLIKFWLSKGVVFTLILVTHLLIWYIVGRYMKYLIQILLAPLLAYISAITEQKLTGKSYDFHWLEFASDILRGILLTLRNIFLETLAVVAVFLLSLIFPLAGIVLSLALFMVNCYFMGFNFIDYAAERKRMSIGESAAWMKKNYMAVSGFGLAYNLVSVFPILDWLIAPISAASGGAILFEELNTPS